MSKLESLRVLLARSPDEQLEEFSCLNITQKVASSMHGGIAPTNNDCTNGGCANQTCVEGSNTTCSNDSCDNGPNGTSNTNCKNTNCYASNAGCIP